MGWKRRVEPLAPDLLVAATVLIALGLGACASGGQTPPPMTPQTMSPVADPENAAPAAATSEGMQANEPASEPEPPAPVEPPSSAIPKTIVIDEGGEEDRTASLVAAARAERERRETSAGPTVVINDENLKSKAIGQLTVARPEPRPDGPPPLADSEPPEADSPQAEDFWRSRMLRLRTDWRDLVDEVDRLESEVALLRRRFYEEDDPYYRDSQIKPAWDRALDRLREARLLADEARQLVVGALEDGRRRGALPGWLREGIELEPGFDARGRTERNDLEEHRTAEPTIYDPDDDGGSRDR